LVVLHILVQLLMIFWFGVMSDYAFD